MKLRHLCTIFQVLNLIFTSRSFLSNLAKAIAFTALSLASPKRDWNPRNASKRDFLEKVMKESYEKNICAQFRSKNLVAISSSSSLSESSYMFLTISSMPIRRKSPMEASIPQAIWQNVSPALEKANG